MCYFKQIVQFQNEINNFMSVLLEKVTALLEYLSLQNIGQN